MKSVCVLLALALPLSFAGLAHAGAKKQSAVNIRFYPETTDNGGEFSQKVELINPKRTTYMSVIAVVSEREIKSYYPFQAPDGSYGVYFRLDDHGTRLLAEYTVANRGAYLLVFFNGRHVIDLYIDRAVQDGIAVIPSGLTKTDIALLDITFPMFGHEGSAPSGSAPKKAAKQKPSPTPKPSDMPRMSPALSRQSDGTMAPAKMYLPGQAPQEAPPPVNPVGQPLPQ